MSGCDAPTRAACWPARSNGGNMIGKKAALVLGGLVMAIAPGLAVAGHYEAGYRAYEKRDLAGALKEWQAGADAGEMDSTYELAIMFRDGEGIPADKAKAFALTKRAAEAGYYSAVKNMVASYHQGIGVPADDVQATAWLLRGAETGDSDAMRRYGAALRTGAGVKADRKAAADWYERSFLYDDFASAKGIMISESDWNKYPMTTAGYDELVEAGSLPKPDLEARFRAILAKADGGDAEAQFQTAMMYYIGRGTKVDLAKMTVYLTRAADNGHAMAQMRLANTYIQGLGGNERDGKKAAHWLRQAALQKNPFALSLLGVSYLGGLGVPRDPTLGMALVSLGAFYGDKDVVKTALHARLTMDAAVVDAFDAVAYKCVAQGMQACLPAI